MALRDFCITFQGCYDAVYSLLSSYSIAFIVIGISVLVIEVMLLFSLTYFICSNSARKEKSVLNEATVNINKENENKNVILFLIGYHDKKYL